MGPEVVAHAHVPGRVPAAVPPATGQGETHRKHVCVDHGARVSPPVPPAGGYPGADPP